MTPVQERTTIAGNEITSMLAKVMEPMQHGKPFKDCLIQLVKRLFPEKTEILRTVEKVPVSQGMDKAGRRYC